MNKRYDDGFIGRIHASYAMDNEPSANLNNSHCHNFYEILYVVQGHGSYIVEGKEYELAPGTLMCVNPLDYHCVRVSTEEPYERYILHFYKEAVPPALQNLLSRLTETGAGRGAFYTAPAAQTVRPCFERILLLSRMEEDIREPFLTALLSEICVLLGVMDAVPAVQDEEDDLSVRVIRYLNDNIDKDVSLDSLSRQFFVSKYYLCRAFKKRNDISIHGYLTQKRVMYAKALMEKGESASGAAYRVGFGDYSAFYRAYVKIFGASPVSDNRRQ